MTNKTTEPAALAGIEPVAWYIAAATDNTPYQSYAHISWGSKPDDNIHTEPLYSAATVERLVQERDDCREAIQVLSSTLNQKQDQLAAMTQERDEMKNLLKSAFNYAKHYQDEGSEHHDWQSEELISELRKIAHAIGESYREK